MSPDTRVALQACECTVVRQVDRPVGTPSPAGIALAAVADDDDDVPPGYEVSLMPPPRAAPASPSPWLLVSNNTAGPSDAPTAVVHLSCVTRQPGLFPLDVAQLRLLITQSAACRVATNPLLEHISLWVVHPHLAAAHGITSALPPGVTLIDDGPAAIGRDASTTSCDLASASAEVVKCIKAERQARSAVAALQHRMDVATKSLGHAKAAAAAAVEAAASATPSPPSAPGSTDSRQGRGGWPHLPPLELPLFEGSPGDRKAVVAHKRAVEAARVAYAEALEAAASAERAAKRAKRTDKADAARPSAVTAVAVQRPSATQMVEETASAAERGTADVDALRAQLNEAAAALAAAERATDAIKRALSAAQATAAQATAAAAVSVQQPLPEPKAIEAMAAKMDEDARPAIPPAVQLVPQPGPLPGPPPPDVAWHSGAAGPSAPSLWGAMLDAPPLGFWPVLSLSGGYEGSQFPPPPPGEEHPLAM